MAQLRKVVPVYDHDKSLNVCGVHNTMCLLCSHT